LTMALVMVVIMNMMVIGYYCYRSW
jgi:hypothetical protein